MQQDVRIVEFRDHLVGVGDEVRRQVAAIELHAFDDFQLGLERLGFLDRDHALIADLLHGLRDEIADFLLAIGGDGADLCNFLGALHLLGALLEVSNRSRCRKVDAALQVHRVHAGGNGLGAFAHDGLGQHGGGGGAVTGFVIGARGNFANHLRAHVLELVFQFDFLGDRHTVLRGARGAEGLVDHDVAALRAQRHLHGIGQRVDALEHLFTGVGTEFDFFSHGIPLPLLSRTALGEKRREPGIGWFRVNGKRSEKKPRRRGSLSRSLTSCPSCLRSRRECRSLS